MSRFACDDERKLPSKHWNDSKKTITDEEIYSVVKTNVPSEKPTAENLHDRIEELQFELECCYQHSKDVQKRMHALKQLLNIIDVDRFEGKNKLYLTNILKKINQLVA